MPVDWVALAGVIMGTLIVLIPVAGLTARFAFKPIVESLGRVRQTPQTDERLASLESRMALLENQMEGTEAELRRLSEESEFRKELARPPAEGF
ncbi:MAG TPA: hypothetical protein VKB18_02460 [Gemmatimonadota bacterium]|nr:hypothetical protein [Gemmatimonadota bacterium]